MLVQLPFRAIFPALVLLALSSCSPLLKVYSEAAAGVNLAQYYSYAWQENPTPQPGDPAPYPLSAQAGVMIRQATEVQLLRHGYQPCDTLPDLLLHYHVVVQNRVYFQHEWRCGNTEPPFNASCHRVQPVYFREGTLIIDFIDARTGRQVWRGAAVGVVEPLTSQAWEAEINAAVRRIFKKFPVRPLSPALAGAGNK